MSYQDRCRICLLDGAEYKIFESSTNSIHSKFFACFKEEIENLEGYPENICESCYNTLDAVYEFVTIYKKNRKLLECGLLVIKDEVDSEISEGTFEPEIIKNEPLSDSDDWPEPQDQKSDIFLTEIKAKLKNLKEIDIKKEPLWKSPCKKSKEVLSVSEDWNGERHEKTKEIHKQPLQDLQLSPVNGKGKKCDICGEVFKNIASHKSYVHNNKIIKCTICPRILSGARGLKKHMLAVHSEKSFVCEPCGKSFGSKVLLAGHIKRVHQKTKKKIKYACNKCGKVYTSKNGFLYHDRNAHTTGLRPSVCETCGKSFICQNYLTEHQRLHTGETPYKCPVCGRGYAQKGNMRSHMKHNHRLADLSPEILKEKPIWLKYLKRP